MLLILCTVLYLIFIFAKYNSNGYLEMILFILLILKAYFGVISGTQKNAHKRFTKYRFLF